MASAGQILQRKWRAHAKYAVGVAKAKIGRPSSNGDRLGLLLHHSAVDAALPLSTVCNKAAAPLAASPPHRLLHRHCALAGLPLALKVRHDKVMVP